MAKDIDTYIDAFPPKTQKLLRQMRKTIHRMAPKATETISYGIPTFVLHGNLVHFAGYKNHIGFYPGASGIAAFKAELSDYKSARGSVQFPLGEPLPLALVQKIVKFRVNESKQKLTKKGSIKNEKAKPSDFPAGLAAPALRALAAAKVKTLAQLARRTESEVSGWHGMGPKAMSLLKAAMRERKMAFSK